MHVTFRTDASVQMGGGHVLRCLTLANALAKAGAQIQFVCSQINPVFAERLQRCGHLLSRIESSLPECAIADWDLVVAPPDAQRADAELTMAIARRPDWIVVDHYQLDRSWQERARREGARIAVIDDLANRLHDCDLLIDQTLARTPSDYRKCVPANARLLLGTTYALLRPEFANAREWALPRRSRQTSVTRILISCGSTDIGGITAHVLSCVLEAIPCAIDVVMMGDGPGTSAVREIAANHPRVAVHFNIDDLVPLMATADISIGAAGTTSWERCCLGLPTLAVVLAGNQRNIAQQLEQAGAQRVVDFADGARFKKALLRLYTDRDARRRMSAAGSALVDGLGAGRVALALAEDSND